MNNAPQSVQDELYADTEAKLALAIKVALAGNCAQARAELGALLESLRYEPKWGVKANGNELLAEHAAIVANVSRFTEAHFSEPIEASFGAGDAAGMADWHGLHIRIEHKKGDVRKGDGWEVRMPADYGEIYGWNERDVPEGTPKRLLSNEEAERGADGDYVDCWLGECPNDNVYVVNQKNLHTGKFDEHKAFLNFKDAEQVKQTYCAAYSDGRGPERMMGEPVEMEADEFKAWLRSDAKVKCKAQAANAIPDISLHRKLASKYRKAIAKFLSAAEHDALDTERDAAVGRRSLIRYWHDLLAESGEEGFAYAAPRLAAEERGEDRGDATSEVEEVHYAQGRKPLVQDFASRNITRLRAAAQRARANPELTEREIARAVRREAKEIEEAEGLPFADNEAGACAAHAQVRALKRAGYKTARWITMHDDKVRESHRSNEIHGPVELGGKFPNGLRYPHDPEGPIDETINCRCWLEGASR